MISYVWAEDEATNIGYHGKLPWHLPADLHHFRNLTINHPIIMGRKTFASLPGVLPGRLHVVLSHDDNFRKKYYTNKNVLVFNQISDLKTWIKDQEQEICVIGGNSLFELFKEDVKILHRTIIHEKFKGDVQMPRLNYSKFHLINEENYLPDNENKYAYSFLDYQRK
ncbi:dihydrofolate reductase [Lactobacillus sp. PV034]|uniref:dihydrofolate reductase n=1 Tax=Lactobacillus sp. PV034 TaxID=2594495 RepID=UPI0022403E87|nr:dihydrofolate reductase [Lactobacillus sp. PV034]QNQ81500.1 dihydrofolate reductase [Lactobacillus sp. PV034]